MTYKSKGLRNAEIGRQMDLHPRRVVENLLRARHKLGASTLEQAIALFAEARTLRGVAHGFDQVESLEQLPPWQERLRSIAEEIDPRSEVDCVHGLHIIKQPCEDCLYEKPGKHAYDGVEVRHPVHGQVVRPCRRCRRNRSSHLGVAFKNGEAQ